VSRTVSQFSQHVLNPIMAHMAGSRFWYTALLRHTGRRSGNSYATPLMAMRVSDGFLVALPYGTNVDWLRNLQAARRAPLQLRGQTYEIGDPVIVDPATALPQLSAIMRNTVRWFGAKNYVKLKSVPTAMTSAPGFTFDSAYRGRSRRDRPGITAAVEHQRTTARTGGADRTRQVSRRRARRRLR
jgi:deazaflavin-dependent oxidoreductase (nitroreductase family)